MNKKAMRHSMIQQLKNITLEEKKKIEFLLTKQLYKSPLWQKACTIGITCSKSFEWDTKAIMKRAWKENKRVAVPKSNHKQKQMEFYLIKDFTDLTIGYKEIMEPVGKNKNKIDKTNIDLLIVPGIVFDLYGFRIGFGGGFYDRFLVNFHQPTVSLVSELQLIRKVPTEPYDLPVQYIVTEKGWIKSKQNSI